MNKQIKILILFVILLDYTALNSQPWLNLLPKEKSKASKTNFYDIQQAFNQYWKGKNLNDKSVTKGKGCKPYKRWEAWMQPRVYPNGSIPLNQTWLEYQKEEKKYKSKATSASDWKLLGPSIVPLDLAGTPSGLGRVNCISFHPQNNNIIYTGSPSGGFWKSTNGGINWTTTTDDLASIGISDIAINPKNPNIIYIATGDGDASDTYTIGILKSIDGGTSWNETGFSFNATNNRTLRKLLINPSKPDTLIAATSIGLYRSGNAGTGWTLVQPGNFKDLEFKSGNPDIVYAARYGATNTRFYKSINGGTTFSEIATGVDLSETLRLELAVGGISSPGVVYALYSSSSNDGFHSLWKSVDEGVSWTRVYDKSSSNLLGWAYDGSDVGGQGWYDLSLVVGPLNADEVYVGGINIWKSIDSGKNWKLICNWTGSYAPYVHADHHCLNFSPSGILFNGNDGGLYKSINGGLNWTDISNGLKILQIDRIGVSQSNPDLVLVGNQDNGTMKYNGKTGIWTQIYGGDGCECIVDYNNDQIIYISSIKGEIKRSDNGGGKFKSIQPEGSGEGVWHTPYVMSPVDSKVLYAGFADVWKTNDRGTNWKKISSNLAVGDPLRQIGVAASDTNYIYATNGTKIWKTSNSGIIWTELPKTELSGLFITYIVVDNKNPNKLWVCISGYSNVKKVFYSDNGGFSWVNYSENLPNVPINCMVREDNSNDALHIGTDIGVYFRDASMKQWERFNNGLPNVEVSELEIQYSTSRLIAGTRGRGLYQTPVPLSASFENLLTQCFDGVTIPVGWETEILKNKSGNLPAIDFISASVNPTGFMPKKCSNFARFNSFTCESGDRIRLKTSKPVSAIGADSLLLTYEMTIDNEYPDRRDSIITQWSADGANWNNIDTLSRYIAEADKWTKVVNPLPKSAKNLANLYIAFEFISAYGNDMHLDDINLNKVNPEPPRIISLQTNENGTQVELNFNKEMTNPIGKQIEFSIDNGNSFTPLSINLKTGNKNNYLFDLPTVLKPGQNIKMSYNRGSVSSTNGGILESFVNKVVANKVIEPFSVEVIEISKIAQLYPNPNSGEFEIKFSENLNQNTNIQIFGIDGKLVYSKITGTVFKNQAYKIQLNTNAKGIYKVKLTSAKRNYIGTFVLQ